MLKKQRKPFHPGVILDEHYIKPLNIDLRQLAAKLGISQYTLAAIRACRTGITPEIALALANEFGTTPQLWLNLQEKYNRF